MAKTKPAMAKGATNRVKGGKNIGKIMTASAPGGPGGPSPQIKQHISRTAVKGSPTQRGQGLSK